MPISVINLASETARWHATARQFSAAGLKAVRLPAVCGSELSPAAIDALYSARLNARLYHKPLGRGEIGCYASHLNAWRALLRSGAPAMAIFEDDIEIEGDLPQVLRELATSGFDWDVAKLLGRPREPVRSRRPLTADRCLISYRRVPSYTGAYVVTARGAEKLLAARQPFGRPVDVDLRHWWECDLDVRGVWPYPARRAAWGRVSTIGERQRRGSGSAERLEKLSYQAGYTWMNWRAVRQMAGNGTEDGAHRANTVAMSVGGGDALPTASGTGDARPASTTFLAPAIPAASSASATCFTARTPSGSAASAVSAALRSPPVDTLSRRRNLVVLRAGDQSLHAQWLEQPQRDFDIFVSYYGEQAGRHQQGADFYELRPGPKWPCLHDLLQAHPQLIDQYEAFWFPDDDLLADSALIDRMFAFCCAYRLCLAQPALTRNSYHTWDTLLQDRRCHIRYTGFVEVMAPIFSRAALRLCAPTFAQSRSGWGLDWLWPRLCEKAGLGRIAIIDATPVRHTRPVGGELYRNHPGLDPRRDAERLLRRYGIEEVRAVAKYSFEGQVREVSLPLVERLVFWLKRLNGRRKHRAHA